MRIVENNNTDADVFLSATFLTSVVVVVVGVTVADVSQTPFALLQPLQTQASSKSD